MSSQNEMIKVKRVTTAVPNHRTRNRYNNILHTDKFEYICHKNKEELLYYTNINHN